MVKKSRKSQMESAAEEIAPVHEPEAPLEVDVAGPLTLDEAKAVGDVSDTYQVNEEQSEGLFTRASQLLRSDSKDPENLPVSAMMPEATPDLVSQADEVPQVDVEAVDPDHSKKVSFAEDSKKGDADVAVDHQKEEKKEKKKSFFKFLSKKSDDDHESHEQQEAQAPAADETSFAAAVAEGASTPDDDLVETPPDEKPKKKHFLSGIFHRKEKDEGHKDEHADDLKEEANEAAGNSTEQKEELLHDDATQDVNETPGVASDSVAETSPVEAQEADGAEGETPKHEKKKSFFGSLFAKKRPNSPQEDSLPTVEEGPAVDSPSEPTGVEALMAEHSEEMPAPIVSEENVGNVESHDGQQGFFDKLHNDQQEPAEASHHEDAAMAAAAVGVVGVGVGAIAATSGESDEKAEDVKPEGDDIAVVPVDEEKKKPAKQSCWHRRKEQAQPAEDSEVVKSGTVQKKGAILGWNRLRHCRITSDGVFQWAKTEDYQMAKGLKMQGDMKIKTMDAQTALPYTLRVYIADNSPIILVFKEQADRDSWLEVFTDMKARLSAAEPDTGQAQVLKSSSVDEAAGTGQAAAVVDPVA